MFDNTKPSALMLGRFQPWHGGHRALFERLLGRYGQVVIMIRNMPSSEQNPFCVQEVEAKIHADLRSQYEFVYTVHVVHNIVHIGWGRDVGYTSGAEDLGEEIHQISATQIRQQMKISEETRM